MNSFRFAFRGVADTIKNERNMRVHGCFAFYVVIAGLVTHISAFEWISVAICIGLVMSLECFNTAVEALCDTICPEKAEGIRITKDASAGAVLCAAIASTIVGGVIFFNEKKISAAAEFFKSNTTLSILILLTLIPLSFFARGRKREQK